ncbi:MAG: potassium channel protein [Spirochaetes bacterium]|nr:potassium channel protein [Spirochaetota bacterium]
MRKNFRKSRQQFMDSRFGLPVVFFIFYFFIAGLATLYFEASSNKQFTNLVDGIWWAVITVSTTGYGDKVPMTIGGRLVTIVTIVVGIGVMSFLSGTLASIFVDRSNKARSGLMEYRNLKNHIIICGWKMQMNEFLTDILNLNPDIDSSDIVIVSNIEPEKIELLKKDKRLSSLMYVRGEYFSEATLGRINIKEAKKVIILADRLESNSASEVDSRTVMTVLTVRGFAKNVYICAELLDRKFENYIKEAMCDEIIFSRNFNRKIIAKSSSVKGISNILYQIIDQKTGQSGIITEEIENEYINEPFLKLKTANESLKNRILLGILENTGSPYKMKVDFLREAQKTANVSKLVNNLQEVKGMEVNNPVLIPDDDYVIQKYSRLIFLERKTGNA